MAAPIAPVAPVVPTRRLSFLIASERDVLTRSLAESLRAQGNTPLVRNTVEAAADALASTSFDVLVLDGGLPSVDWSLVRRAFAPPTEPEPLEAVERRHIAAALRFTRGNRRNAAQLLGIARSTLLAKIRKYGLDRDPSLARV
jgi:DNA-binding NtrC family response regulator